MTPLRLVGAAIIFFCAMTTVREYGAFCRRRIAQASAFLSFIRHLEERVCVYLMPISVAASDFEDDELSSIGFAGALHSGGTLYSAFTIAREKLLFSEEQKELLSSFFRDFGGAYAADERARIEKLIDSFSRLCAEDEKRVRASDQATRALILAVALGLIILIL